VDVSCWAERIVQREATRKEENNQFYQGNMKSNVLFRLESFSKRSDQYGAQNIQEGMEKKGKKEQRKDWAISFIQ